MSFAKKIQAHYSITADAKMDIYIGWYVDSDPEFGTKLDSAKAYAALYKSKGSDADLAKAHQYIEKEHKGKGIVMSLPSSVPIAKAKEEVRKAVGTLIMNAGLKPS